MQFLAKDEVNRLRLAIVDGNVGGIKISSIMNIPNGIQSSSESRKVAGCLGEDYSPAAGKSLQFERECTFGWHPIALNLSGKALCSREYRQRQVSGVHLIVLLRARLLLIVSMFRSETVLVHRRLISDSGRNTQSRR